MRRRARRGRGNEDAFDAPKAAAPPLWSRDGSLRARRRRSRGRSRDDRRGRAPRHLDRKGAERGYAPRRALTFVEQREQLGTGHAVSVALGAIDDAIGDTDGDVVILPVDTPLLRRSSVSQLLERHRERQAALTVLSARLEDPTGYGRIDARKGRDARAHRRRARRLDRASAQINEVNTSIMVVRQSLLGPALRRIDRQNAQNEYYLTDLIAVLHEAGHLTPSLMLEDANEAPGSTTGRQLAARRGGAARADQRTSGWRAASPCGIPTSTYVDADVELAPEVSLLPGTVS